nr:MAG TPA: hypothetical protein [Caudoviricetes sp.]
MKHRIEPPIPEVLYQCPCGGAAEKCESALLCENCLHIDRCHKKKAPPETKDQDPKKELKAKRRYAAYRRLHRSCFDCKYCKAIPIDVECIHPTMKKLVPKGGN